MGHIHSKPKRKHTDWKQLDQAEVEVSRVIESKLAQDYENERQIFDLLLVGPAEAGKTTLLERLALLHGKGLTEDDRQAYVPTISNLLITAAKTLIQQDQLINANTTQQLPSHDSSKSTQSKQFILNLPDSALVDSKIAFHLKCVWEDPDIQHIYLTHSQSCLNLSPSAEYFFNQLEQIGAPGYIPSAQDVLNCRTGTRRKSVVDREFMIINKFRIINIGGQHNPEKWLDHFSDVTAIIFVVALDSYDQFISQPAEVGAQGESENYHNRLKEALKLFNQVCNSNWFSDTPVILLLNKRDAFQEKVSERSEVSWKERWCNVERVNKCLLI